MKKKGNKERTLGLTFGDDNFWSNGLPGFAGGRAVIRMHRCRFSRPSFARKSVQSYRVPNVAGD